MKKPADRFEPVGTSRQQALLGVELASFRQRAFAIALDGLIIFAVAAAFGTIDAADRTVAVTYGNSIEFEDVFGAALSTAYFACAIYVSNGWTPGKYAFSIRVVSLVDERISFWHSLDRALGYALSSVVAGLGFVQYFTRPNHQTIHDRLAQTIVVRAPRRTSAAT